MSGLDYEDEDDDEEEKFARRAKILRDSSTESLSDCLKSQMYGPAIDACFVTVHFGNFG